MHERADPQWSWKFYIVYLKTLLNVPNTCFDIAIIPLTDKRLNSTSKII